MVITAQVDMNLIVISERIVKLQPSKKMNLIMMNESLDLDGGCYVILEEFEWTYHLLHCFSDVSSLVESVEEILYCSNERSHAHS